MHLYGYTKTYIHCRRKSAARKPHRAPNCAEDQARFFVAALARTFLAASSSSSSAANSNVTL
jgi:hypothetical protein